MFDVAVIGGGVVGALIAQRLSHYQLQICILEKAHDVATGASCANSGIVHAGFDAKEGTLKARLNVRGAALMPAICRDLGVKYRNNGSLVIGFDADDRRAQEALLERGKANGVPHLTILEGDALRAKEPKLSPDVTSALWAPTGGIVCPYELTIAAIGNAMDNGTVLYTDFEVQSIHPLADGYEICAETQHVCAKTVINAAGVHADAIARMVGDDSFSITPRRGEYVLLDRECGSTVRSTVFRIPGKMGKGILVTPTVDGNLLCGPTSVNIEEKDNTETTAEGLSALMEQAAVSVPGIPFGKSITSFCGLRAVGSTGDFIITSPKKSFWNVAGIESPGLSASPAIAEYITERLQESGLSLLPKEAPVTTRPAMHAFREMTDAEKNEVIRRSPAYGHILCRCEEISEGEILDAIHREPRPRDLDGVKRRTRAQMGRCQGGFCAPYIVELLAREWGIPYEAVTKCGGSSYLNTERTKGGSHEAD